MATEFELTWAKWPIYWKNWDTKEGLNVLAWGWCCWPRCCWPSGTATQGLGYHQDPSLDHVSLLVDSISLFHADYTSLHEGILGMRLIGPAQVRFPLWTHHLWPETGPCDNRAAGIPSAEGMEGSFWRKGQCWADKPPRFEQRNMAWSDLHFGLMCRHRRREVFFLLFIKTNLQQFIKNWYHAIGVWEIPHLHLILAVPV